MNIREWSKAHWRLLAGVSAWALIIAVVLSQSGMSLSNRIQGIAIITLVFITWFYAVQTQALVKEERRALEEEKKRRSAEFGERKIMVLLGPLSEKLKDYYYCYTEPFFEEADKPQLRKRLSKAREGLHPVEGFFRVNMHMASDELRIRLEVFFSDVRGTLWNSLGWTNEKIEDYLQEKRSELETLIEMIETEIEQITAHIQSTYGISTRPAAP
jgi:hypothetical protein